MAELNKYEKSLLRELESTDQAAIDLLSSRVKDLSDRVKELDGRIDQVCMLCHNTPQDADDHRENGVLNRILEILAPPNGTG